MESMLPVENFNVSQFDKIIGKKWLLKAFQNSFKHIGVESFYLGKI